MERELILELFEDIEILSKPLTVLLTSLLLRLNLV